MKILDAKFDEIIMEEYCDLYSKWFGEEKPDSKEMDTKKLVELIENKYKCMEEKRRNVELVSIKERIKINSRDSIDSYFYTLCLEVLNLFVNEKGGENKNVEDGFIVEFSDFIFATLEKVSIFNVIRKLNSNISYKFVDLWVVGNLIAAILSSVFVYNLNNNYKGVIVIVLSYSILRVFEVIIYQINVLLFHPYRARKSGESYKIKSVTRMVIALLHNYIEIMFWYSTMVISIIILNGDNPYSLTWVEIVRSNILCIVTLDGSSIKESVNSNYKYLSSLIFLEIISGMIMTIISLARFIGALPGAESQDGN